MVLRQHSGRLRIFTMYQQNISVKDAVAALKREYGYFGGSHTFLDGTSGMVHYRPDTGLRLQRDQPRAEVTVKWPAVEKRIRQLIQEGSYLTPDELEKYKSDHLEDVPEQGEEAPAPTSEPVSLAVTQADIDEQLHFEAPFTLRNLQIYELFQQDLSVEDRVEAVKKAFGRSSNGHPLPNGIYR